MTKFNKEEFEKDLIKEILLVQDKLGKRYGIKFSIDVQWKLGENIEIPAM